MNIFHTVVYNQTGWKFLSQTKVKINGIEVQYKGMPNVDYTTLPIKEIKLKIVNGKFLLDLGIVQIVPEPLKINADNKVLAIDLGIKNLANGVDNDGHWVTLPNKARKINRYFRKQISKVQSKMDKCIKGSNKHKKLKKTKKETVQTKGCTDKTDSTYSEQEISEYELQNHCSR